MIMIKPRLFNTQSIHAGLVSLGLLFLSATSSAHTFYWVDVKTHLNSNDKGLFNSVDYSWKYDKEISEAMVEGLDLSDEMKKASLNELANAVMNDLATASYFVSSEEPIKLVNIDNHVLTYEDERLELKFKLTLTKPQDMKGKQTTLSIYDPQYLGEFRYLKPEAVTMSDALAKICKVTTEQEQVKKEEEEEESPDADEVESEEEKHKHTDNFIQHAKLSCQ